MRQKPALTNSDAHKLMPACIAEAQKNKWNVAIAIVEPLSSSVEIVQRKPRIIQRRHHFADSGDIMTSMASPATRTAAGSVGTVETQFLDLPQPVRLDCGVELHPVRIAYETYGTLSAARDNVVLVCHALSGDAHAAGFARTPPAEATRDGFMSPRKLTRDPDEL